MLSTTERFYTIAGEVLSADLPLDPWIQRYYASTKRRDGAEQYVRFQTDLLDLAGIKTQGLKVIDAGCGFGFTMVVHALLGAEVTGIELSPLMAQTVETYLPILPEDVRDRINVIRGDVAAMALPDQSADVVLSLEAISHYLDVGQFVQEAARVLRPGGVLIIADGNNGSNLLRPGHPRAWRSRCRGRCGRGRHDRSDTHCWCFRIRFGCPVACRSRRAHQPCQSGPLSGIWSFLTRRQASSTPDE